MSEDEGRKGRSELLGWLLSGPIVRRKRPTYLRESLETPQSFATASRRRVSKSPWQCLKVFFLRLNPLLIFKDPRWTAMCLPGK